MEFTRLRDVGRMRTGRLSIARGIREPRPAQPRLTLVEPPDRVGMIERLAQLHRDGLLDRGEYEQEKSRLLGGSPEAAAPRRLEVQVPVTRPRPSLVGLAGWRIVPAGVFLGVVLSFATQPERTFLFFDEVARLAGA